MINQTIVGRAMASHLQLLTATMIYGVMETVPQLSEGRVALGGMLGAV